MRILNADMRDVTEQTLAAFKKVMGNGEGLAKAATITLATNIVAYDLEAPFIGGAL